MEKLTEKSCVDFAEALASKAPVPGGGGAAALAGALGAALCSMVGNFTVGKKKYAAVEDDVKRMLQKGEALRTRLLELTDEDAAAFEPLSRAYSIPKDAPDRDRVLEEATLNACAAPVEMVERCADVIDLLDEMLLKGSRMLVSDVGCGALLAKAAMESAAMNVYINTCSMKDRDKANEIEKKVGELLKKFRIRSDGIIASVTHQIRGDA